MKRGFAVFPILLLIGPILAAGPALARLAGPDGLLSAADRRAQEQALQNALEYEPTGRAARWSNPETGHRGAVMPIRTYRNAAGRDCRTYRRTLTLDGRRAVGHGTRCRTAAGRWARPLPPLPPRRAYPRPYRYGYGYGVPVTLVLGYGFGYYHGHHHHRHRGHKHRGHKGGRRGGRR